MPDRIRLIQLRLDLRLGDPLRRGALGHDLRICAKTVGVVLTGRGAS